MLFCHHSMKKNNRICAKNKHSFDKTLKSLEEAQPFGSTLLPKEKPVQNNTVQNSEAPAQEEQIRADTENGRKTFRVAETN